MSVNDNLKTVRNIYESFDSRNFDQTNKSLDPNVELIDVPSNMTFRGFDGSRQFMQNWANAFPDARCEIKNISAGEDWAVVEFHGVGTHKGTLRGPEGEIKATGKHVDLPFCDVHKLKNGKIVQSRSYYDTTTLMRQLGLIQELKHH